MSQVKDLFRKYGRVAVGVHLTVYAASFADTRGHSFNGSTFAKESNLLTAISGLYMAAKSKVDVESVLVKYGLLHEREADQPPDGWLQKTLAGGGSAVVLAFICNKALMPVRAPITFGLTPMVARALRQHAANKGSVSRMSQ